MAVRSAAPWLTAHEVTTSAPCHRPPARTRAARIRACSGLSGMALAIRSATGHCRETTIADGPREAQTPATYAHRAITGTSSQGMACATDAPTKVETDIPATATATSMIRDRVTPWKDTRPAGCAPSAANVPYSTC